MRRIVHPIALLAVLAVGSPARPQDVKTHSGDLIDVGVSPIEDVAKLRKELESICCIAMRLGGIDTNAALKTLATAILDLDKRIERLERK